MPTLDELLAQWVGGGGIFADLFNLFIGAGFVLGAFISVFGGYRIYRHGQRDNVSLSSGIISVIVGAIFLSLPFFTQVLQSSVFGEDSPLSLVDRSSQSIEWFPANLSFTILATLFLVGLSAVIKGLIHIWKRGNGDSKHSYNDAIIFFLSGTALINFHDFMCMLASSFSIDALCF